MASFECRYSKCGNIFKDRSNRRRHELNKRIAEHQGELVLQERQPKKTSVPFFDAIRSVWCCPSPGCQFSSGKKSNVQRHINSNCSSKKQRSKKSQDNKTCPNCKMQFTQKYNCDRHVRNVHQNDTAAFVNNEKENEETEQHENSADTVSDLIEPEQLLNDRIDENLETPTMLMFPDNLNASFVSNNGEVLDLNLSIIDTVTPIYEVSAIETISDTFENTTPDTPLILGFSPIKGSGSVNHRLECESTDLEEHGDVSLTGHTDDASGLDSSNQATNFIAELKSLGDRKRTYEALFSDRLVNKVLSDMRSYKKNRDAHSDAVKYIQQMFPDLIDDQYFIQWLANKIGTRSHRLSELLKEKDRTWKPRNSMHDDQHQKIYDFWLKNENSTQSVDRRSGRDKVKISKEEYVKLYTDIHDPNIEEERKLLKSGLEKIIFSALRKIYMKPVRELHQKFLSTSTSSCSKTTFFTYKPFYVKPPTEREKISCMCMRCFNAQCLLKGINTYRKLHKLENHTSVTKFLLENHDNESHPEIKDTKMINYYVFESKEESYIKNGKEIKYTRTARVPKSESVCDIVNTLKESGESYLRHRSHVENVGTIFPIIRKSFSGTYIELDFSENISEKPKYEVQNAHFSGVQYSLHCAIVEPGEEKYVFHLSDDTTHDPAFVEAVLEDIFEKGGIKKDGTKNDAVMIKSDNAPTQYKNKWAFGSMQRLADTYNMRIIRIYGAAGHGKGLIDAMSSFGVKSILRQNIIANDWWFNNSSDICEHLEARCNPRMRYTSLSPQYTNEKRENQITRKIIGCNAMHFFVYEPNSKTVLRREYLCDCQSCLNLDFGSCEESDQKQNPANTPEVEVDQDDCALDDDSVDQQQKISEFIEVPSFISLQSFDAFAPLYLVRVEEKGLTEEYTTICGRQFKKGEYYVKGRHLHVARLRGKRDRQQFAIGVKKNDDEVAFPPDEIYGTFIDIDSDLTMNKEEYKSLCAHAQILV